MPATWEVLVAEKKVRQAASIPKEWVITPPSDDVLDVTDIPAKCGLLSARELEITEVSSVALLLGKIATGAWSAIEVTTAFCKRAAIAHQVVRTLSFSLNIQLTFAVLSLRQIVLQRSFLIVPSRGLPGSMSNSRRQGKLLVPFMAFRSRSRTR